MFSAVTRVVVYVCVSELSVSVTPCVIHAIFYVPVTDTDPNSAMNNGLVVIRPQARNISSRHYL